MKRGARRRSHGMARALAVALLALRFDAAAAPDERAAIAPAGASGRERATQATGRDEAAPAPPGGARAALVIEPATLALGALATAEIVVSTPPGHALRLVAPLPELPGVWTLATELVPVERTAERWTHRVRLRLRPREVGRFEWPAIALQIEDERGSASVLTTDPRAIEVAATLPALDPSAPPFGLRDLPGEPAQRTPVAAALAGALGTLFAIGLVLLVRRARRGGAAARAVAEAIGVDPREAADAFAGVRAALDDVARDAHDPALAAGALSTALRRLLERRWGVAALACTTEELRDGPTPWGLRSRWPRWLALLAALDALQFPPFRAGARERLQATIVEARALVDDASGAGRRA